MRLPTNPLPRTSDDSATEQNMRELLRRIENIPQAVVAQRPSVEFHVVSANEDQEEIEIRSRGGDEYRLIEIRPDFTSAYSIPSWGAWTAFPSAGVDYKYLSNTYARQTVESGDRTLHKVWPVVLLVQVRKLGELDEAKWNAGAYMIAPQPVRPSVWTEISEEDVDPDWAPLYTGALWLKVETPPAP